METQVSEWLQIIRGEYLETPGLRLTKKQVQRLFGLEAPVCDALLEALVDGQFLRRMFDGSYARRDIA